MDERNNIIMNGKVVLTKTMKLEIGATMDISFSLSITIYLLFPF